MDLDVLERLIGELASTDQVLVVIGAEAAVAEMRIQEATQSRFHEGWATIEAEGWHVHLNMKAVESAQFVEAEDHGHNIPRLYFVRLADARGEALIRFYFPSPWLDSAEKPTEFQPERLKLFEGFRDRYVGRGEVVFSQERRRPDEIGEGGPP